MKSSHITLDIPASQAVACPMNFVGFIVRALREDGVSSEALLSDTGLTEDLLVDPYYRAEFPKVRRLILNAIEQTGDVHLGPRLAKRFDPNSVGLPAYAAMTAPSFRDGVEILRRFFFITFPGVEFSVPVQHSAGSNDEVAICVHPKFMFEDVAYFVCASALTVCNEIFKALLRREQVLTRLDVTIEEPGDWAQKAAEFSRAPIRFGADENRMVFPATLLDEPLPGHDPINHTRLVELCEKAASDAAHAATPVLRVLGFLETGHNFAASLSEAADALGWSERSLRRQLDLAGTSYRKLVDQVRESRARELLVNTDRPIQAIAFELGYDTPSNFGRSFKRWTGTTPRAYRLARKSRNENGQN